MFVHVVDDHTTLEMVEMRDADEIFALVEVSRMYLREWLPWVDAASSVEDSKAFARASHKQYADGDGFQCCIRYRGEIAGIIGFSRVDWLNKRVEIGYWLEEELQGPEVLGALLPQGTELDAWRGKTFVSMVGFRFLKTRVGGIPIPFHRDFDEVNLRFYVKRDHPEGVRACRARSSVFCLLMSASSRRQSCKLCHAATPSRIRLCAAWGT